ncbi:hypothetical protein HYH03_011286 [Edaphochlamys debaryana]|uniref:6-phosphofructo-2-kinase domain-containing protein n=1 Tax=Edaphochlamys debaryana TaxID=47281 RepID=A0A835Y3E2_9CHLO|nr:hypothetical protein HYH03_011286 [Edaphochlamys debaryana]|eukprot:KAG2490339.1 hypothetical protein HYH03_011286 [Edaphochlamys debaryana]
MERVVEEDAAQLAPAGTGESSSLPPSAAQDRPAAGLCLGSTPNTSRALLTPALSEPQRPGPPARVASVGLPSGHTLMHLNSMRGHDGGPNSSGLGSGNSPLPNSAELSRRLRGLLATTVNFRDVSLELMPSSDQGVLEAAEDADADAATGSAAPLGPLSTSTSGAFAGLGGGGEGGEASGTGRDAGPGSGLAPGGAVVPLGGSMRVRSGAVVRKNKLVIILVGLPGRGKTFLCNKLCCYLNWLGHATRHFNVGQYRRHQKCADEVQDAAFFDHANESGVEARNRALHAALDDLTAYLRSDSGQVAIFDATNTTVARRNLLRAKFHGVLQYMFIETICSDPAVLELNYRNKMRYSPDYKGVDTDKAVADFLARIKKYEEVYEPIDDRNLHYIKLIDMVTGRGHMDINRISGYLPGKIVFFLMQLLDVT